MTFLSISALKTLIKKKTNKVIKIWTRSSIITNNMLGYIFSVYNGKNFINVFVSTKMVGKKLGEFAFTRKYPKHPSKDKKIKNKIKNQNKKK